MFCVQSLNQKQIQEEWSEFKRPRINCVEDEKKKKTNHFEYLYQNDKFSQFGLQKVEK